MVRNHLQNISNVRFHRGQILAPFFSALYIIDLSTSLKTSKSSMFANDTNLTCIGQNSNEIEIKLNKELEYVHRRLTGSKLSLNDEKTEFMLIGYKDLALLIIA